MNLCKFVYKSVQFSILLIIMAMMSLPSFAQESYNSYYKVSLAYALSQTSEIKDRTAKRTEPLYTNENYSYSLEAGISVLAEDNNKFFLGVYWSDIINQGISREVHRPYSLEVFSDYIWEWDDEMFVKIGVGYRLIQDDKIVYYWENVKYTTDLSKESPIAKITARFAIGRHFGDYSLSLEHHSQWLRGKPFDNEWEYELTSVNLAYIF